MQNRKFKMQNEGVAKATILNHLRSKYLRFALCTLHFAFRATARQIGIWLEVL